MFIPDDNFVYMAIFYEYKDKVRLCPTTQVEWCAIQGRIHDFPKGGGVNLNVL